MDWMRVNIGFSLGAVGEWSHSCSTSMSSFHAGWSGNRTSQVDMSELGMMCKNARIHLLLQYYNFETTMSP